MTPELKAMMLEWLDSDDPIKRKHAENRLKIGDTPSDPASYPHLLTQAGTVVKAAMGFALDGFHRVDEQEHDRRLSICQACEHFDAEQNRCRRCGCYLAVKPWLQRESCPDGKW